MRGRQTEDDRSHSTFVLAGLGAVGIVVSVFVGQRAVATASERDRNAVDAAATRLSAGLRSTLSSLRGVDGLAADGLVTAGEFESYAADVLPGSDYTALAYSEIVSEDRRAAWEAESGLPIVDTSGGGQFSPAGVHSKYVAVRYVYPLSDTTRPVLGFNITSDRVRAEGVAQATDGHEPVFVGPISLARSALPGLFAIHDVRSPTGVPIGFVSSGIGVDPLLARLNDLEHIGPITIAMDGRALSTAASEGPSTSFELGGRTFTIKTADRRGVSWWLLLMTVLGSIVALGTADHSRRRDRADHDRRTRAAARAIELSALAEELADAGSVDDVVGFAVDRAGAVLRSDHTNVGWVDRSNGAKLFVVHDAAMADDLASGYAVQHLDEQLPLADCVRTGNPVAIADREQYRLLYPHVMDDIEKVGIHAMVCHPMTVGRTEVIGVVGYAWHQPIAEHEMAERAQTSAMTADIIGRALERALTRDATRDNAERLSAFATALAAAQTPDQVTMAVRTSLPTLFDASEAALRQGRAHDAMHARAYTLPTEPGDGTALWLRLRPGHDWSPQLEVLAQTVTRMIDTSWTRARQHLQEHAVLERLQTSLLALAPAIPQLDVAVGYQGAMERLGIGGDWYSVIDLPDATFLVVGDIAGHGPDAIAVMAEVKTILRHLITAGTPIHELARHADASLARREAYASAVIARVDKTQTTLTLLNAGHPFPLVRRRNGTVVTLSDTHRPWLGIGFRDAAPTKHEFAHGDTLLLYTDGLIEDRSVPLTDSIALLRTQLGQPSPSTSDELVQRLLRWRANTRTPTTVDDDIALIAATRR